MILSEIDYDHSVADFLSISAILLIKLCRNGCELGLIVLIREAITRADDMATLNAPFTENFVTVVDT